MKYVLVYLLMINCIGILLMYVDKQRAIKGKWRIPEKRLFGTAILGGSVGILLGMKGFRHKTKHMSFVLGVPTILIIQLIITILILTYC